MNAKPAEINVYWRNLCTLKKFEKEQLAQKAAAWRKESGENILFEYFGLGEIRNMDEKIKEDLNSGAIRADVLVSTEANMFYDRQLLLNRTECFQALEGRFPLRRELTKIGVAHPGGYFHPCLTAVVAMISNDNLVEEAERPTGWREILDPKWEGKVLFGGIDKPGGFAFLVAMWYLFGDEGLKKCVKNLRAVSAPAAVLNAVSKDEYPLGVVPLIFSGRQGIKNVHDIWPREGAIAIPSYVAVRANAPESAIAFIEKNLFSKEMQEFYSTRGMVIPAHPEVEPPQIVVENNYNLICPPWEWFQEIDMNTWRKRAGR